MLMPRIIPCLLIKNKGLVKTQQFEHVKYVGDPINTARIFSEKFCDELMILDIDATTHNREPDYRLIAHIAAECEMPICYGGGVKTPSQAKAIISLGVEKIAASSVIVNSPELLSCFANAIGAQSVVLILDVKHNATRHIYEIYIHNGKINTTIELFSFLKMIDQEKIGEIVINAIERDGMMNGYDLDLARAVRNSTTVPITLLGGASSLENIQHLISEVGVIGAAAGSLFVYKGIHKAVLINYPPPDIKNDIIRSAICAV